MLLAMPLPDPNLIDEHAQRHVGIARALVLEQQVQEGSTTLHVDAEEQIAVAIRKLDIDEGAGLARQARPGDAGAG